MDSLLGFFRCVVMKPLECMYVYSRSSFIESYIHKIQKYKLLYVYGCSGIEKLKKLMDA